MIDYNTYDKKYSSTYNRPCIDGTITGCGKCVAYCKCELHPGFLTENLKAEHKCKEKNCIHYLPKPKAQKRVGSEKNIEQERIMAIAVSATSEMEGMRVMRAAQENDNSWILYYVSISDYPLGTIAQKMAAKIGTTVKFYELAYHYEIAASLIFGIDLSLIA